MAVRNLKAEITNDFLGLNLLDNRENLPSGVWFACTNWVVSASGSAVALRSPYTITKTVSSTGLIKSMFNAIWSGTAAVLMDVLGAGTTTVTTYRFNTILNPTLPTSTRTGQADHRIDRIMSNDKVYAVNGTEVFQMNTNFTSYQVGIGRPTVACTTTVVAGGSLTLNVGASASYAYRNAATTHVGLCSAASVMSGATGSGNNTLRVAVVAATTTGIDGIVLFLSKDGESNRFLNVDVNGNMIVYANSTANIDITSTYYVDINTPETAYNDTPLLGGTQIEAWKDRLWITGFGVGTYGSYLIYSGYEAVYAGVPQEAYPPYNVVTIPTGNEIAETMIATPVGLLVFSDRNAYLLTGDPADNVVAPENSLAVTAHLDSLNWNLGTRSPNTVVSTPYGIMWFDDAQRIQLWPFQGLPKEVGLPLRPALAAIRSSSSVLAMCEAVWYHDNNVQYYIMTAPLTSTTVNTHLFIIAFYTDLASGEVRAACSMSDIAASTIAVCPVTNVAEDVKVFIGGTTDIVQQIFDFERTGSGWGAGSTLAFSCMGGNMVGNYSYLHSMRYDANAQDITVRVSDPDGSNIEAIAMTKDGATTFKGFVGRYGIRQAIEYSIPITADSVRHEIINQRLFYSQKQRVL